MKIMKLLKLIAGVTTAIIFYVYLPNLGFPFFKISRGKSNSTSDLLIVKNSHYLREKIKPTANLAIVVCGGRLHEAVTLLKSAIIFGRDIHLNIIAFVDNRTKFALPRQLQKLQISATKLDVAFDFQIHDSWFPPGEERLWRKMFEPCSTQRLFFPSLLPNVDSVLYMDTDTLFLSNVNSLWTNFEAMNQNDQVIAAMAAEDELSGNGWYNLRAAIPYYGSRGLNAGIMLMNLTRFRQLNVESVIREIYNDFKYKIVWADQDLLNIYFHYFPHSLHELPCEFNFRTQHCDCQYEGDCSCKSAIINGISILHGNRKMFHNPTHRLKFTKYIYNAFKRYNLDEGNPRQLYENLKTEHKKMGHGTQEVGGSPCNQLEFKDIFQKFKLYLESV